LNNSKIQVSFLGGASVSVDDLLNDEEVKLELNKTKRALYSSNSTLSFILNINPNFVVGKTTLSETIDSLVGYSVEKGLVEKVPDHMLSSARNAVIEMMEHKDPNFRSYFGSTSKPKLGLSAI